MKALTATVFGLFMVTTAVVHADAGMDEKAFRAEFKAAFLALISPPLNLPRRTI